MKTNRLAGVALGIIALAASAGAATYQVDAAHSTVGFAVRHMGISEVKGTFTNFTGTIDYDASKPEESKARGTVQAASINTGVEARDKHLRSADFFDVAKFPEIAFETLSARKDGDEWVVKGKFTLHGVTREIELRGILEGPVKDPWGKTRIGLTARTTINRQDYGLRWTQKLEAGELVVGDLVKIELHIEAVK